MNITTEIQSEVNEYVAFFTEKGITGEQLMAQLRQTAEQALLNGRDDLALAIGMLLTGSNDGKIVRRMTTSRGDSFETTFTNEEALAIVRGLTRSDFAMSLVAQYDKPRKGKKTAAKFLSDTQWVWVHKMAVDQQARQQSKPVQPKPTIDVPAVDLSAVRNILLKAAQTLKFPKITLDQNGQKLRLSLAGPNSRYRGAVMVTDGKPFGENVFYGAIDAEGRWITKRDDRWVIEALTAFAANPAEFAKLYGQKTSRCCFCGLELSTNESLAMGYGPICAENWGLPWGEVPEGFHEAWMARAAS